MGAYLSDGGEVRTHWLWAALGALLLAAALAPPTPGAAQPAGFKVYLPLAGPGCGDAICATLAVGPAGICCMGGVPGSTVSVPVTLLAASGRGLPLELVTDGRSCRDTAPIDDAGWEPYRGPWAAPVTLPANWTTLTVRVQLRDAAGNRTPILCDDVALEGFFPPSARP
jgi:hypothetical protein